MNTTADDRSLRYFFNFIKVIIAFPIGFIFSLAGIVEIIKTLSIFAKFLSVGFVAWAYIMSKLFLGLLAIGVSLFAWRRVFSEKLGFLRYSTIALINAAIIGGCVRFSITNAFVTEDFRNVRYPSYIESWPVKTAYAEKECDYSLDKIYIQGHLIFIKNDFRPDINVKVVHDENLTDKYRVEIHYKGDSSKVRISHSDYDSQKYGNYIDDINVWPEEYRWKMSNDDIVYMYKNKEDLTYTNHLAIEKIIIRTAYPEKIDVSNIKGFNY